MSMTLSMARDPRRPELLFGLIGALGSDISGAEHQLRSQLSTVNYRSHTIKLTALLHELSGAPFDALEQDGKRAHVSSYMDAGNALRRQTEQGQALALLALNKVRLIRREIGVNDGEAANSSAYILNSLKHPREVQALRRIYGPAFIAIAVYSRRSERIATTQERLRIFHGSGSLEDRFGEATTLVDRDENEQFDPFGQHVSDAFALADVVVGDSGGTSIKSDVERFVQLMFGNWTWTPRTDETGMYFAQGARYRSASMARQVGAAILRRDGTVIATGFNDVPKAGGGLYSEADRPDGRDHARIQRQDASDFYKREVILDFLKYLIKVGLVNAMEEVDLISRVDELIQQRSLKDAMFMSTIDYVRAVHAEMAALTDAARTGVPVAQSTLYVTTFPCHDCTKHIVASGIERVVFVEPYTKSLTSKLFSDSVAIENPLACGYVQFNPFVGVLPRRYSDLFEMRANRKDVRGMWIQWRPEEAFPALGDYSGLPTARIAAETLEVEQFNNLLREKGIVPRER